MPVEDEIRIGSSVRDRTGQIQSSGNSPRAKRLSKKIAKSWAIRFLLLASSFFIFIACAIPSFFLYFVAPTLSFINYSGSPKMLSFLFLALDVILVAVYHTIAGWVYEDLQEQFIRIQAEAMARGLAEAKEM